ncbi:MAG: radical SAM protein [Catonella sp.]|jgi:radical SAM domain protein|uniref:radical SAM protein n=1 Tax=Catonella sp. TaxID=2382125 RepID=UPI003FA0CB3F
MRIIFELTQKCNMRCKYCFAEKNSLEYISLEDIERVCEEVSAQSKIDYVTFTGGESLLYSDLDKAIQIAQKYTNHILLLTNGLLLNNEKIISFLSKYGVEVQVSLDSVVSNYHDIVRGNKDIIISNILKLRNSTSLTIGIVCVISSMNTKEIPKLISFCKANSLSLDFELIDIDKANDLSLECLSDREISEMLENLSPWGEREQNILKYKLFKILFSKKNFKPSKCFGCRNTVLIRSNGIVSSCFHNTKLQFGNLKNSSIILNAMQKMKKIYEVDCFSYSCLGSFF